MLESTQWYMGRIGQLRVLELPECILYRELLAEGATPPRRFQRVFDAFWTDLVWEDLLPQKDLYRKDRTQDKASILVHILFLAAVDEDFPYAEFWES